MDEIVLVFDSLRDPRDMAEIIHLGLAAGVKIILTGSSLLPTHPKVLGILTSWLPKAKQNPKLTHVTLGKSLAEEITTLRKKKYFIIGTSPSAKKSLFEFDLNSEKIKKIALVFGTETSGLSTEKMALTDEMLSVPMKNETNFFTIRAIAPIFTYYALHQKKLV